MDKRCLKFFQQNLSDGGSVDESTGKRNYSWGRSVVVITTAQPHSTKPELRLSAGSNPARGVSEIRDGEDL